MKTADIFTFISGVGIGVIIAGSIGFVSGYRVGHAEGAVSERETITSIGRYEYQDKDYVCNVAPTVEIERLNYNYAKRCAIFLHQWKNGEK